ncbi:hypothetical protein M1247_20835 [Mycobacterium sp. 21AC1]|uniref:hypothetical protein n=1 Tax=[Mycobacterium] appelbergii TaxID=2939269 RepID=UPI0029391EF5|nr:hypothetical protein [Mycobacterium sp. 21AC1]MDV3127383.1 hypothetical protein [Mycobacterium sp. 21AC1]
MRSRRLSRRLAATAGIAAIIGMGGLAACGTEEQAPETTTPATTTTTTTPTTPSTAPPPVEPTEKNITPGGGNKFTPTHVETPAPPTGRRGYSPNGGG